MNDATLLRHQCHDVCSSQESTEKVFVHKKIEC